MLVLTKNKLFCSASYLDIIADQQLFV